MIAQPESFERLPHYIGRDEAKNLLVQYAAQITSHPECIALYFEGQGGLGKTRLLQLAPTILYQSEKTKPIPFCCAELLDFYKFENRDPLVIEQRLIEGLKQPPDGASLWYRLPAEDVDRAFASYQAAYHHYQQAQESQNTEIIEQERARLRTTFIDGWNIFSQQRPMVIAFDTLETLFFRSPPDALINRTDTAAPLDALPEVLRITAGVDLVIQWMEQVLPQLQHTLVLCSGRPIRDGTNTLVDRLRELRLLRESVYRLTPFTTHTDIQDYLRAYIGERVDAEDIDLYYVQQITDGRPLLLTCYAETRRAADALPPGLPAATPDVCTSRADFEDWLIATLLNPLTAAQVCGSKRSPIASTFWCMRDAVFAKTSCRPSLNVKTYPVTLRPLTSLHR
ncbi:MAG: hypothetical protein HC884_09475 [Chloroflexaceae bacterium]|nr:hypothetical protein [Chloroflexaceae bacterium]